MHPKIVLFVLGQKGHATVRAALQPAYIDLVERVVIGDDKAMQHDFSAEILALCQASGVAHVQRKDYRLAGGQAAGQIAMASGWRWLIKEEFQALIVCHDSLLPKYRGFNPLVTALLCRDAQVGVTAILANQAFDRGNIIAARSFSVAYPIRVAAAMETMAAQFFELTGSILDRIMQGDSLAGSPQDEQQASYSVWRDEEDYRIDWQQSAAEIEHFIHCVSYPYAGASTTVDQQVLRITEAVALPDLSIANRVAGKVLFTEGHQPIVICGRGLLKITGAVHEGGADALPLQRFRVRFR